MELHQQNKDTLLLSTSYFPPIEYMALLSVFESAVIELNETYQKQTYRNRCKIMTANGCLNLSIPVLRSNGRITKTNDVCLFNKDKWYVNHQRAIDSAYSGSAFYLYYKDELSEFFSGKEESLSELNKSILNKLLELLGVSCNISYSDEFTKPGTNDLDFRFLISPKVENDIIYFKEYYQVFSDRFSFAPNLSILDLIFNMGPESKDYLQSVAKAMGY